MPRDPSDNPDSVDVTATPDDRRAANLHSSLTRELLQDGINPKLVSLERNDDLLERYRNVPLHAMFLYSSEDTGVDDYVRRNWGALDSMSGDCCDIHPTMAQLHGQEDAYDLLDELHVPTPPDLSLPSLPGILFWNRDGDSVYVPFGHGADANVITACLRAIFGELRRSPTLGTVKAAKETLTHTARNNVGYQHRPIWKDLAPLGAVFLVIIAFIAGISRLVSPLLFGAIIIAGILGLVIVSAIALRDRNQLSEEGWRATVASVLDRLPLLRAGNSRNMPVETKGKSAPKRSKSPRDRAR